MDEASMRSGRPDRRMASWRPVSRSSPSTGITVRRATSNDGAPEVPRARWVGVGVVMVALVGTIVLAATAPIPRDQDEAPVAAAATGTQAPASLAPSASPVGPVPDVAPAIAPPDAGVTRDSTIDLLISVPRTSIKPRDLRLAVYRNGKEVERSFAREAEVVVSGVGLRRGRNTLTAALVGPGGAGPLSEPVVVTLDPDAPVLRVITPDDGQSVQAASVPLRGTSEPGAAITIANDARDAPYEVTADREGAFKAQIRLAPGRNRITVSAEDTLGNERSVGLTVLRAAFDAQLTLTVAPRHMAIADLPRDLRITLTVLDSRGRPVNGAPVIFTLYPFGQPAENFQAVTRGGKAVWRKSIPRDGALRGDGDVSASVTLPDGSEQVEKADFSFE